MNLKSLFFVGLLFVNASAAPVKVYVFAGQSNMGGLGFTQSLTAEQKQPNPLILAHQCWGKDENGAPTTQDNGQVTDPDQIDPLTGIWEAYQVGKKGQFHNNNGCYGPEFTSLPLLQKEANETIYIVKYAMGNTNLARDWNSRDGGDGKPGIYYARLIAKVDAAMKQLQKQYGVEGYVAGTFWMQGEADKFVSYDKFKQFGVTSNDAFAKAYEQNLRNLIADLRTTFNQPNMPFVLGETSDKVTDDPNYKSFSPLVRDSQHKVAQDTPNVAIAQATDLPKIQDGIHISGAGQQTLGQRFAECYLSIVKKTSDPEAK
ncbi:MAG: sialate O-acetylesterase [Verrucomicrobiota bacterium]